MFMQIVLPSGLKANLADIPEPQVYYFEQMVHKFNFWSVNL